MIKLYLADYCPFCQKVINATRELMMAEGTDFEVVDAPPGSPGREEMLEVGGKEQIPFMVDGKTNMYESDDIIAYLQEKFSK